MTVIVLYNFHIAAFWAHGSFVNSDCKFESFT